ncbi:nucleoside triphosphate pyrophosphohydrolase [Paratractidigestivibacter faecalis]|uniref:nucleoside triphosphate pyrophosphohydrolase n=1 Tax=Paratractidigestivibacter faecalis TaxID=2292441 RepID=UPI0018E5036B|nr:nucleoside triphosphate pyrophosphohydrolase [Paratractidigestivibacter faecalis]
MEFVSGKFNQPECRLDDGRALSDLVDEQNASRAEAPAGNPEMDRLVRTIWRLRQADGCPWDREQTHGSITKNMVEEAYEAVDAIEANDVAHLCEELGDVLEQVLLHAQIAADAGEFTIEDVAHGLNEKLVRRHPHVFGDLAAASDGQAPAGYEQAHDGDRVLDIWDDVKRLEREARGQLSDVEPGLLDSVPQSLPALMQAQKISKRAAKAGFEWADLAGVWDKVAEERAEFEAEEPGTAASQEEFGDLLFALVNVARWSGVDAEEALAASNRKFRRRWARMEELARAQGRAVEDLSTVEQNELWDRAKGEEKPAE